MAAPMQMRMCVRKPAGRRLYERSIPIMPPQMSAQARRTNTESVVTSRRPSKTDNIAVHSLQLFDHAKAVQLRQIGEKLRVRYFFIEAD